MNAIWAAAGGTVNNLMTIFFRLIEVIVGAVANETIYWKEDRVDWVKARQ